MLVRPIHQSYLIRWCAIALVAALAVLGVVVAMSYAFPPTAGLLNSHDLPPALATPGVATALHIFAGNTLVLLFGVLVCYATGFVRALKASPGAAAARRSDVIRVLLVVIVVGALTRQVWVSAHEISNVAFFGAIPRWKVGVSIAPHALIELTAMYLPLVAAAHCVRNTTPASRDAAVRCLALGLAMIAIAATFEVTVWKETLKAVTPFESWLTNPPKNFDTY